MANYSLVINSKFKPFTYQELLHPALMATQAHQQIEDAYSELSTKANVWDKMANEQTDPKAHALYKKYANDLKTQADTLATEGLNPTSRQAMLNMRSRYATDIVPIEQAYNARREQAKAQAEIMAKDPTHFFARDASTTSLDAYLDNPSLDTLKQNYSGALLTQQVSNAAAALAKDARNDPKVQTELRRLLPYQYETIRRTGFDPETVRQAILNSPEANKILTGLVDNVMSDSGIGSWNFISPEDRQRVISQARNYANQGLWSAVGQTQYGNVTDSYGMNSALERQRHSNAMKEAKAKSGDNSILPYRRIANSRVLDTDNTKLNNDLNFLKGLSKTGVNKLSKKAPERSITSYESSIGAPGGLSDYDRTMGNFRRIAKEYGLGNVKAWGPNNNATLIKKIEDKIRQNIQRSQTYQVNMTDQTQIARILQENSNTFSIKDRDRSGFVEVDSKGKVTNNYLSADDAAEIFEKGKDFNLSYDPKSGFFLSYRDGKEFKTVNIEPELLNFGDEDYSIGHKLVNQYIDNGREDYANDLIDEMMTGLYYRFNTQAKKESATDSDIQ